MNSQSLEDQAFQYFVSINPMARKIMADQTKYRSSHGDKWNNLTQEEKDRLIDELFIDDRIRIRYEIRTGIVDTDNSIPECFPRFRIRGGEKIVHHVESEEANCPGTTHFWKDEFSGPFSWETKSQMEMPFLTEVEEYDNLQTSSETELLQKDSSSISHLLMNLQMNETSSASNSLQVSVHSLISNYEGDPKPITNHNNSSRELPLNHMPNHSSGDTLKRQKGKNMIAKNEKDHSKDFTRREEKSTLFQDIFQRESGRDSTDSFHIDNGAKKISGPPNLSQLIDKNNANGSDEHVFNVREPFSKFELLTQNTGNKEQEKIQKREQPGKSKLQPRKDKSHKMNGNTKAKKPTSQLEAEVLLPKKQPETIHFSKQSDANDVVAKFSTVTVTSPPTAQVMTSSPAKIELIPMLPSQVEEVPKTGFEFLDNW